MRSSTFCAPAADGDCCPVNFGRGAPFITTSDFGRTLASGPVSNERSTSRCECKLAGLHALRSLLWTGRKRHILVDTLGLPIASRVEPPGMSDRRAGARLLARLSPLFPRIHTAIADAGHESRKLARELLRHEGWK